MELSLRKGGLAKDNFFYETDWKWMMKADDLSWTGVKLSN